MTIDKYLEAREKQNYSLADDIMLYEECKNERTEWDMSAEIGIAILNNDYPKNKKVAGDTSNNSAFYNINFVKDNLLHSVAETMRADADVEIEYLDGIETKAKDLLELEINYELDKQDIIRKVEQALITRKFMGHGVGRLYWDVFDVDKKNLTGKPKLLIIDPRKVWWRQEHKLQDKSDVVNYFHREQYTTQKFKELYPKYKKEIEMAESNMQAETRDKDYYIKSGITNVVIHQYSKSFMLNEYAITDEYSGETRYFLKEEYEDYLNAKQLPLEMFSKGQEFDENEVFPEAVVMSQEIPVLETRWFQSIFIPELNVVLEPPQLVGKQSDYFIMPGKWNPDSPYCSSLAFEYKDVLNIYGVMVTTLLLNTLRLHKPIPVVASGALKNEAYFLNHYDQFGVVAMVDSEWQRKNPNVKAIEWLNRPTGDQTQIVLSQMIERAIDKSTNTPNVSRGISDFSQQSGKQTGLLQMAAEVGNKPDSWELQKFIEEASKRIKEKLCKYKNYAHKLKVGISPDTGMPIFEDVNSDHNNNYSGLADDCVIRVTLKDNIEYRKALKEQKYTALYQHGDIVYEDYMKALDLPRVDTLIKNRNEQSEDYLLVKAINYNPQLKQQIIEMIRNNPNIATEQPKNVKMAMSEDKNPHNIASGNAQ